MGSKNSNRSEKKSKRLNSECKTTTEEEKKSMYCFTQFYTTHSGTLVRDKHFQPRKIAQFDVGQKRPVTGTNGPRSRFEMCNHLVDRYRRLERANELRARLSHVKQNWKTVKHCESIYNEL